MSPANCRCSYAYFFFFLPLLVVLAALLFGDFVTVCGTRE